MSTLIAPTFVTSRSHAKSVGWEIGLSLISNSTLLHDFGRGYSLSLKNCRGCWSGCVRDDLRQIGLRYVVYQRFRVWAILEMTEITTGVTVDIKIKNVRITQIERGCESPLNYSDITIRLILLFVFHPVSLPYHSFSFSFSLVLQLFFSLGGIFGVVPYILN